MIKRYSVMAALTIAALLLVGAGKPLKQQEIQVQEVSELKGRRLVMGTSADYPPFEYIKNGDIIGFDVDVAGLIAKDLGVTLEIKDMEFAGLLPAMNSKHVDFVMATLTASSEREKHADFSEAYYHSPVTMVVRDVDGISSLTDLSGKTVGVQLGSTWERFAKSKQKSIKDLEVMSINKGPQMLEELKLGRVDAVIVDKSQAEYFVKVSVGTKMLTLLDERADGYVIMFPKGSDLREPFNRTIKKLREKGQIEELEHKWLVQKASDVIF